MNIASDEDIPKMTVKPKKKLSSKRKKKEKLEEENYLQNLEKALERDMVLINEMDSKPPVFDASQGIDVRLSQNQAISGAINTREKEKKVNTLDFDDGFLNPQFVEPSYGDDDMQIMELEKDTAIRKRNKELSNFTPHSIAPSA